MRFDQLPDEIIQQVLYYVAPKDALFSFQLVNRRCATISDEPLIWKHHCVSTFRYWHPGHEFAVTLRRPAQQVDWKRMFIIRQGRNDFIEGIFQEILDSKVCRLAKIGRIAEFGYDAKDFLLGQCKTSEDAKDVLARRYWGKTILDNIHRSVGIDLWHSLMDPSRPDPGLEYVLGALDMFIQEGSSPDVYEISQILDVKASEFQSNGQTLDLQTPRKTAVALNRWVRSRGLVGLANPDRDYRNLRNCLIGEALSQEEHDSIPIISSAIYTCLARRIGLDAHCCNFPGHIHVVVQAAPGLTLDNEKVSPDHPLDRMYLDPFGNDDEVPLERLEALLARFDAHQSPETALAPATSTAVLTRTGTNITATYATVLERQEQDLAQLTHLSHGSGSMNLITCLYASMWGALVLTSPETWAELDFFLGRFARSWPEDAWLVEKYLVPRAPYRRIFFGRHAGQSDDAWKVLRTIQRADELPPPVFPRDPPEYDVVPYRVGQIFRHRRYGYLGAITGWSDHGARNSTQERSDVNGDSRQVAGDTDPVNRLRMDSKTYYTYLRTTSPERYVIAEANITIVDDPTVVDDDPFIYAGKYFKRFDRQTCSYVSNNKEQFPDD